MAIRSLITFFFSSLLEERATIQTSIQAHLRTSLYGPLPYRWCLLDSLQCTHALFVVGNTALNVLLQCWTETKNHFPWHAGNNLTNTSQDAADLCCKDTLWVVRANSCRTGNALAISHHHPLYELWPCSKTSRTSSWAGKWLDTSLKNISSHYHFVTIYLADTCFNLTGTGVSILSALLSHLS